MGCFESVNKTVVQANRFSVICLMYSYPLI